MAYEDNEDDYEDDDYEQDGGGELSAEDQAQMNAATLETQQILGPQADKVTKQQIQEALWYYYYDVDKSVAYIINKFIDPAPKVTKTKKEAKKADTEGESISYNPGPLPSPSTKGDPESLGHLA